jgi:hypothetical protein
VPAGIHERGTPRRLAGHETYNRVQSERRGFIGIDTFELVYAIPNANVVNAGSRPPRDVSTYDDWLADFQAGFHVLDPPESFSEFLQPEPVPKCYAASQALAWLLRWHVRAAGVFSE